MYDGKERIVWMINSYDAILTILDERAVVSDDKLCFEERIASEIQRSAAPNFFSHP